VTLYRGERYSRKTLLKRLTRFGYERCERLGELGDFSVRGEAIEIYPFSFEDPLQIVFEGDRIEAIRGFRLLDHETLEEHSFVILLPVKMQPRSAFPPPLYRQEIPLQEVVDLEEGDYAVHLEYGIGRYRGLEKLKTESGIQDHLVLEYAEGDRLYVPCENLHLIQRYIGLGGRSPKLHRLGSKVWQKTKESSEKGITRYALELLELQAKRSTREGYAFSKDTDWQEEFERSFPFRETPDQTRSTIEVKEDMERAKPMDRLLCGDVGYGKTEVALRAAFKAVLDDKQVAMLVPTTILAEQHHRTFSQRMAPYPVHIEMLSRFRSRKEVGEVLKGIHEGSVDIVIGTHMLFSEKIHFKDLGLVIIDEEQRFGVRHKERLKRLRLEVDVLTLTATPIPRTLHLSLMGAKEMSVINTPPEDRRPVETVLADYDETLIQQASLKELKRRGQIYFVTHRVKGIERIRDRLQGLLPSARIGLCHGQMPGRALERVMQDFIDHRLDFLVSTNIIESGIDIPNVNTLFVNRADLFGMADLYQLRGRIGRFKETGYAYFFVPKGFLPTEEGKARLAAIRRFTALGSGFKIAMRDLEIRGAGNILGIEQHGFIQAIGFDLYLRLLREAVERLKFVIILSFVLWNLSFASYAGTVGKIVAIVNDEVITQQELDESLSSLPAVEPLKGDARQKALNRLIEDKLILQKAKQNGVTVSPEELEEVIKKVRSRFPSEEAFQKTLLNADLPYKEFEKRHERQLIIRKMVLLEVRAKSTVSPREMEEYYKTHDVQFQSPEAWHLSNILIRKGSPLRDDEAAKRLAKTLLKRIRKGEDFTALAKITSEGPRKEEGGDLGFVERGKLLKEIEGALLPLRVGGVSHVIETPVGYHLFRVEEKRKGMKRNYKEVKGKIRDFLLQEKIKQRYGEWIEQLKKEAYIKQD